MSEDVFPRRNLNPDAEPWGRKHDEVVRAHERRISGLELSAQGSNRASAGQMGVIGRQIEDLSLQQDRLAAQQARIEDAAKIYTDSTGATHSGESWMPNPPSVSASSLSRKFRITVTGGSAMGTTFLTFSAPGFPRDRALGASSAAILSRVAVLGGAGDPATGQRSWVETMPASGPYTFTAQARPSDQYASAIGLQIDVQPVL